MKCYPCKYHYKRERYVRVRAFWGLRVFGVAVFIKFYINWNATLVNTTIGKIFVRVRSNILILVPYVDLNRLFVCIQEIEIYHQHQLYPFCSYDITFGFHTKFLILLQQPISNCPKITPDSSLQRTEGSKSKAFQPSPHISIDSVIVFQCLF